MNDESITMRAADRAQRMLEARRAAEKSAKPEKKPEADRCGDGAGYLDTIVTDGRGEAQRCAASLGKDHYVKCETKNISDGLPAYVPQTICWVKNKGK